MNLSFLLVTKDQTGWAELLYRFVRGGESIYDIEFMCDDTGKELKPENSYSQLSVLTDTSVKQTPSIGLILPFSTPLYLSIGPKDVHIKESWLY